MKLLTSAQSMNLNDIECPWPADGADLSLVELNEVEKTWLAHQVVAKLQTTRELAERFCYDHPSQYVVGLELVAGCFCPLAYPGWPAECPALTESATSPIRNYLWHHVHVEN